MAKKKWGDRDLDKDGIPNKKDKDRDGDGIPNKKDKKPNKPNKPKKPKDPDKGPPSGGGGGDPEKPKDPNTTYYNIFAETPEIDESNVESIAELVNNIGKNLQSRSKELIAKFTISEVDKLPKNFARGEKYNDEDRQIDFDDIISYDAPEDDDTDIPEMVSPADFEGTLPDTEPLYVFGHSTAEEFIENVPLFKEDGSVEWHIKLSLPDTIGIADYIVEIAEDS